MSTNYQKERQYALLKLLKTISANAGRGVLFGTALLGVSSVIPGIDWREVLSDLSPYVDTNAINLIINATATGIGVEAMGSLLDRLADSDSISNEELSDKLEEIFAQVETNDALTVNDFYHAFSHLRKRQIKISKQNQEIFDLIREIDNWLVSVDDKSKALYLNSLVSNLVARVGLHEYIDLNTHVPEQHIYSKPFSRWEPEFVELVHHGEIVTKTHLASIREATQKYDKFVLIGGPGMGKTTTLRRLTYEYALSSQSDHKAHIPILLELASWSKISLAEFIKSATYWPIGINDNFSGDPIILFLDGLNEIQSIEQKKELLEWLDSNKPPKKLILSCRERDYENFKQRLKLPIVQIEPLSEEQVHEFSSNYLGESSRPFLDALYEQSSRNLGDVTANQRSRSLFYLALNPYFLAALIFIYSYSEGNELPPQRGLLIQRLIATLWERERRKRTKGWIQTEKMVDAFSLLAFHMINDFNRIRIEVNLDWAKEFVPNLSLLKAGENANIFEINDGKLRFYHQLILEYFAAEYLKQNGLGMINHSPNYVIDQFFGRFDGYCQRGELAWDQALIFLCDLDENTDKLMDYLLENDPHLGVFCILSGVNVSPKIADELLAWAVNTEFHYGVVATTHSILKGFRTRFAIDGLIRLLSSNAQNKQRVGGIIDETLPTGSLLGWEVSQTLVEYGDLVVDLLIAELADVIVSKDYDPNSQLSPSGVRTGRIAWILGEIGNPKATDVLIHRLNDYEKTRLDIFQGIQLVGEVASESLKKIGSEGALNALRHWESPVERNSSSSEEINIWNFWG